MLAKISRGIRLHHVPIVSVIYTSIAIVCWENTKYPTGIARDGGSRNAFKDMLLLHAHAVLPTSLWQPYSIGTLIHHAP